jgi:dTDP-4-dehydrorhamnose 3,5-epimerase
LLRESAFFNLRNLREKNLRQSARTKYARKNLQETMNDIPQIIQGGTHEDARGKLTFFNDFDLKEVKRFYVIEHPDTEVVRAWQGHKIEQKWFYVLEGSFKVVLVKPDNWDHSSKILSQNEFILKAAENQVLHIPGGFVNGFKALEANSKMMVFSDFAINDAGSDDFRFDKRLWYDWMDII